MIYPATDLYPGADNAYPSWASPSAGHEFTYSHTATASYGGTALWTYDETPSFTYSPTE